MNRKGFTLIELLATITIVAVVAIVTVPTIMDAYKAAKQEAYDDALIVIAKYVNKEYVACQIDPNNTEDYNSELFVVNNGNCEIGDFDTVSEIILSETGYKDDIESVTLQINNSTLEYEVLYAPVTEGGQFNGVEDKRFKPGVITPIWPRPGGGGVIK